jgi:hypothetical protein
MHSTRWRAIGHHVRGPCPLHVGGGSVTIQEDAVADREHTFLIAYCCDVRRSVDGRICVVHTVSTGGTQRPRGRHTRQLPGATCETCAVATATWNGRSNGAGQSCRSARLPLSRYRSIFGGSDLRTGADCDRAERSEGFRARSA